MSSARIQNTQEICLIIITAILSSAALIYMKGVLVPFVFAIFTYAVVAPIIIKLIERFKIPRFVALGIVIVAANVIIAICSYAIAHSIGNFVQEAGQYQERLYSFAEEIEALLPEGTMTKESLIESARQLPVVSYFKSFSGKILNLFGDGLLILIFTLFMILGEGKTNKPELLKEILNSVAQYVSFKLALSLMTGFGVWVILLFFEVELATMFALLTILLNFIPTVGSIIATLLPLPVAFLQMGWGLPFILVLSLLSLIQFLVGNVLEPKWLGDSMDLHPITILLGLVFWGLIWGVSGMFLAVPITATVKIISARLPVTYAFSELLAGRIGTPTSST